MVAALPGVLNFGNGNKRLQLQLDKLFQLGYYDERQNFEALEKSRGDVKKAVAFISDGTVPDIEQGYESPTESPERANNELSLRHEFTVTRCEVNNEIEGQSSRLNRLNVRACIRESGVEVWPTDGGPCVVSEAWGQIRAFTLSTDSRVVTLTTSKGEMQFHTTNAQKLMDSIIATTTELAKVMKRAKKQRAQREQTMRTHAQSTKRRTL